jgi:hypothetical protein
MKIKKIIGTILATGIVMTSPIISHAEETTYFKRVEGTVVKTEGATSITPLTTEKSKSLAVESAPLADTGYPYLDTLWNGDAKTVKNVTTKTLGSGYQDNMQNAYAHFKKDQSGYDTVNYDGYNYIYSSVTPSKSVQDMFTTWSVNSNEYSFSLPLSVSWSSASKTATVNYPAVTNGTAKSRYYYLDPYTFKVDASSYISKSDYTGTTTWTFGSSNYAHNCTVTFLFAN